MMSVRIWSVCVVWCRRANLESRASLASSRSHFGLSGDREAWSSFTLVVPPVPFGSLSQHLWRRFRFHCCFWCGRFSPTCLHVEFSRSVFVPPVGLLYV